LSASQLQPRARAARSVTLPRPWQREASGSGEKPGLAVANGSLCRTAVVRVGLPGSRLSGEPGIGQERVLMNSGCTATRRRIYSPAGPNWVIAGLPRRAYRAPATWLECAAQSTALKISVRHRQPSDCHTNESGEDINLEEMMVERGAEPSGPHRGRCSQQSGLLRYLSDRAFPASESGSACDVVNELKAVLFVLERDAVPLAQR